VYLSGRVAAIGSGHRTFEVEEAGCASCATRVRDALSQLAVVHAVDIRPEDDVATVSISADADVSEAAVNGALREASRGAGHAYRVKPGSWRIETGAPR
jgi:copper chaperone CopZ